MLVIFPSKFKLEKTSLAVINYGTICYQNFASHKIIKKNFPQIFSPTPCSNQIKDLKWIPRKLYFNGNYTLTISKV